MRHCRWLAAKSRVNRRILLIFLTTKYMTTVNFICNSLASSPYYVRLLRLNHPQTRERPQNDLPVIVFIHMSCIRGRSEAIACPSMVPSEIVTIETEIVSLNLIPCRETAGGFCGEACFACCVGSSQLYPINWSLMQCEIEHRAHVCELSWMPSGPAWNGGWWWLNRRMWRGDAKASPSFIGICCWFQFQWTLIDMDI